MRITQSRLQQAAKLQGYFAEKYPKAFLVDTGKKPLALNTFDKLCEHIKTDSTLSKRSIKRFLGLYCADPQYIEALKAPNAMRIDLDGNEIEPVSNEHQQMAMDTPRSEQIKFSEKRNRCPGTRAKRQRLAEEKKAKLKLEQKAKKKEAKAAQQKKKAKQRAQMSLQERLVKRYQGEQAVQLSQLVKMMKAHFPKAFGPKSLLVPIAGAESKTIIGKASELLPRIQAESIKKFWSAYLNSEEYMNAMLTCSHLLNLEGQPVREISEGARADTRNKLEKAKSTPKGKPNKKQASAKSRPGSKKSGRV